MFAGTLETATEEEVAKELVTTVGGLLLGKRGGRISCSWPRFPIGGAKPKDMTKNIGGNVNKMRDFALLAKKIRTEWKTIESSRSLHAWYILERIFLKKNGIGETTVGY